MDLPWGTHRGLIEPLSKSSHIKRFFIKNFIQFIAKIKNSTKPLLRTILSAIMHDTRSTTGKNLRGILLLSSKGSVEELSVSDANHFPYFPMSQEEEWKTEMLTLLIEERDRGSLDKEETEWFNYLCTS